MENTQVYDGLILAMKNKYPNYIVSKNRWDNCKTGELFERLGMDYHIVVEEDQYDKYAEYYDKNKLIILDPTYLDNYETFDDLGDTKSKGPGAARNFAWDHSIKTYNSKWHWVWDDNIYDIHRLTHNKKISTRTLSWFRAQEEFADRYENVAIAGPNYTKFCKATDAVPPVVFNTRIYSCLMIRNDIPYRWRGRYNEDTDICLRVLKDGWCTIQFNAFLQDKATTQKIDGGNTEEFYSHEGTLPKSQMLKDMHPDVTEVVWKFNRWHHHVDYRPFKDNLLKKCENIEYPDDPEYGMRLIDIGRHNIGRRTIEDENGDWSHNIVNIEER